MGKMLPFLSLTLTRPSYVVVDIYSLTIWFARAIQLTLDLKCLDWIHLMPHEECQNL